MQKKPDLQPAMDAAPWANLKPRHIATLYRIAKDPAKGARPFFVHARSMIDLRCRAHLKMTVSA